MSFSLSTFMIEIEGVPTAFFQAKWHVEAERICQEWIRIHWDELAGHGSIGGEFAPIFKLCLARSAERAAYDAEDGEVEYLNEVKIVKRARRANPSQLTPTLEGGATDQHETRGDNSEE